MLRTLDKKWAQYTSVDIKADLLNSFPEDLHKKLYDVNLADTDMLIVETMRVKDKEFVFKKEG
jgi:hypothetical protein